MDGWMEMDGDGWCSQIPNVSPALGGLGFQFVLLEGAWHQIFGCLAWRPPIVVPVDTHEYEIGRIGQTRQTD